MRRREVLAATAALPALAGCPSFLSPDVRLGAVELANMSETTETISVTVSEDDETVHDETHELESQEGNLVPCDWSTDRAHFVVEYEWEDDVETMDLADEDVGECAWVFIGLDAEYDQSWMLPHECPDRWPDDVFCAPPG